MYDKIHSMSRFDLDLGTVRKTIIDDICYSAFEEHLREKVVTDEMIRELELSFDNHYIDCDIHNSEVESCFSKNNPTKVDVVYDDIGDSYKL